MPKTKADQNPLVKAIIPFLLAYQLKWILDRSRFKVGCWSRQSGKSFAITLEAVLQAFETKNNQILFSASKDQALENMKKVQQHLDFLDRVLRAWARQQRKPFKGLLYPREKPSKQSVRLANGAYILARSTNARTARGYTGDTFWDEAAITQHDREFWKAIFPVATRGGFRVRLTSTPLGDSGIFHERWVDESGRWSRHLVTLPEAVDQGLQVDIEDIRAGVDQETFEQEYLCRFLSDATSYFPWELLRAAVNAFPGMPDDFEPVRYVGVDLGRKRDLTCIYDTLELPGGHLHVVPFEILHKVPFEEQERRIDAAIERPSVQRACIDATWNSSIAERARKKHGPKVEPVVFTNPVKEKMVTEAKRRMEQGSLSLDAADRDLQTDCHAIRRFVTAANNIRFDAERTEKGHADRFWAGPGLGVLAATGGGMWRMDMVGPGQGSVTPAQDELQRLLAQSEEERLQEAGQAMWDELGLDFGGF